MGGTSMGAFIAALIACDYDSVEITHITRETFVNNNYLNDYTLPRVSLIEGRRFMHRLADIFGEQQIEDLRRSFYCISTSLTTGAPVIHDHGTAATWVGTSMAVPGIAPPIAYKGQLLVDGGVVDNLPTDVMQGLERGSIIASSVSSKSDIQGPQGGDRDTPDPYALLQRENREGRPGFREILLRTATLTSDTVIQRESARRADVYISMPVAGVGLLDWKHMDLLIERGYRHALEQLAPLRDSLVGKG
jgi:NTE family protein